MEIINYFAIITVFVALLPNDYKLFGIKVIFLVESDQE